MHYDENVIDKNLNCNFITDSNNFNSRILEITKKESLKDKLLKGLDVAYKRMIAEKRKNNQKIVVRREGKIVTINP
mgnify:CR=1 FL=1